MRSFIELHLECAQVHSSAKSGRREFEVSVGRQDGVNAARKGFQRVSTAGQDLPAETDVALGATGVDLRAAHSGDLDVTVSDAGANGPGQVCDHNRALIREQVEAARSRDGDFEIDPSAP